MDCSEQDVYVETLSGQQCIFWPKLSLSTSIILQGCLFSVFTAYIHTSIWKGISRLGIRVSDKYPLSPSVALWWGRRGGGNLDKSVTNTLIQIPTLLDITNGKNLHFCSWRWRWLGSTGQSSLRTGLETLSWRLEHAGGTNESAFILCLEPVWVPKLP